MPGRKQRLQAIRSIIESSVIETQEDLAKALTNTGYQVTQATVSRDIRELGLGKVRLPDGRQKYAVMSSTEHGETDRFVRVMKEALISMDQAQNILVIKTVSGMAMAVATALDALKFHEIVGCIAGDDTIMVAVRTVDDTTRLIAKIQALLR